MYNLNSLRWLSISTIVTILCGCAVHPEVNYHNATSQAAQRADNWVTFKLTDTAIVLATVVKPAAQPTKGAGGSGAPSPADPPGPQKSTTPAIKKNKKTAKPKSPTKNPATPTDQTA